MFDIFTYFIDEIREKVKNGSQGVITYLELLKICEQAQEKQEEDCVSAAEAQDEIQ